MFLKSPLRDLGAKKQGLEKIIIFKSDLFASTILNIPYQFMLLDL